MTLILALDTATVGCSAAAVQDGHVLAQESAAMERGQSEALMPMLERILGACAGAPDAIAVTRGPGAFTGLRIGLAAARGLALAYGIPCIGVTTFEVFAHQAASDVAKGLPTLVVIDSKRSDVYAQLFDASVQPMTNGEALAPEALAGLLAPGAASVALAGDARAAALGALKGIDAIEAGAVLPDPVIIARIAEGRLECFGDYPPTPLYLRPPDVTMPAGG